MGGIIFLGTKDLSAIKEFYIKKINMHIYLDQQTCCIFKYDNLLLGFCQKEVPDTGGIITFFCPDKEGVDKFYNDHSNIALSKPKVNDKYNIYNFFAKDPEGRTLEFQAFLHDIKPYMDGLSALMNRRSIRKFKDTDISPNLIESIIDLCRYSPTSRNTQGFYFVIIKDRDKIDYLASLRGTSSEPIRKAPVAIAVCSDPSITRRKVDDGIIAAYHFILCAFLHGLGTCWIAAMDTDTVKKCIGIPHDHYIATITPLGYPDEAPAAPEKKHIRDFIKFID